MSREDASRLFDSGVGILSQLTSSTRSLDYDDLLVEAMSCLDQAVDLIEKDDPSYSDYVYICASAHALCLERIDYSSVLDAYLASAPLLETLVGWYRQHRGRPLDVVPLDVDEQVLDDFWNRLDDVLDEKCSSLNPQDLLAPRVLATHIGVFSEAASLSQGMDLEKFWHQCRATALYLRLGRYNPDEVSLSIASVFRMLQLNASVTPPSSAHTVLQQIINKVSFDSALLERRALWLRSLAAFYMHRHSSDFHRCWKLYQSSSSLEDLDNAISAAREGLSWTRNTGIFPVARFDLLLDCANSLYERFSFNELSEELDDSLDLLQEASTYAGISDERMSAAKQLTASVSADLANVLAQRTDSEIWLRSLFLWRRSIDWADSEDPEIVAQRLFGLGNVAARLYDVSDYGLSEHVSEASDAFARAASLTTNTPFAAEIHFARAHALYGRFLKTGQREDLTISLSAGDAACQLVRQTPSLARDDPYWTGFYMHGLKLTRDTQENFKKRAPPELMANLENLIDLLQVIVPFPNPHRLKAMNRLGIAYTLLSRVQHRAGHPTTRCLASLKKALELHETALKETPAPTTNDVVARAQLHPRHTLVGSVYQEIYGLLDLSDASRIQYLDLAVDHFRQATLFGATGLTMTLSRFVNLAKALEDRYDMKGQRSDLDECISLLLFDHDKQLVGHSKSFFDAATHLVQICHKHNVRDKLLPAYKLVFNALRKLSYLGLTSMARQKALVDYSVGHACDAAASALDTNDPIAAVEVLEEGRSLFFSQLLPTQIDTSQIRLLSPDLALSLDETLDKVRQYSRATDSGDYKATQFYTEGGFAEDIDEVSADLNAESRELRHYGTWLERYLREVRALPGFSDYMQLKPFSRLKQAAELCPVVYINISQFRCDALIVGGPNQDSEVQVIPLDTSWAKVHDLSQNMRQIIRVQGREIRDAIPTPGREFESRKLTRAEPESESPDQTVHDILRELWDTIVQPVLSALGYLQSSSTPPEHLPHLYWCPSGPSATFLPLHAAGNYDLGPEHWTMTHVVSAYTTTLSSLLQTLERKPTTVTRDAQMLLISQPASPPSHPLPCVVVERDGILASISQAGAWGRTTVLHDADGRVENAIEHIPAHEILHLACHGKQDIKDPLESAIILHDGHLTIREIIKMPLPLAELVYLSACQTATGDINTPDESLSLAGGFLFAGYKGAVATMWSIDDRDGADIAQSFYKHLLARGGAPAMNAAFALHCAIQDLRKANPTIELIRWISFVYLGVTGGHS